MTIRARFIVAFFVAYCLLLVAGCATPPATEPVDDLPEHPVIQWIDAQCKNGRVVSGRGIILPGRNARPITLVVDDRICAGSI